MHYFIEFLISMVPLIELRGAIPYSVGFGLNMPLAYLIAIVGNILPMPFIFLFARRILVWGAKVNWPKGLGWVGKFFKFCLEKGEKGGKVLTSKAGRSTYLALLLFVGIPLPGTGGWTGSLIAALLKMDFKKAILACFVVVLLATVIVSFLSYGLLARVVA